MTESEALTLMLKARRILRERMKEFVPDVCGREIETYTIPNVDGLTYISTYFGRYHLDSSETLLSGDTPVLVFNTQCLRTNLPYAAFRDMPPSMQVDEFARRALDFLRLNRTLSFGHTEERRTRRCGNMGRFVYSTEKWPSDGGLQFREHVKFQGFKGNYIGRNIGEDREIFSLLGFPN